MNSSDHGPASPAARAVDLTKTYGKGDAAVHALDAVNVEFERGRFTAVMGPSGSGKSTLMHCMAGLDVPTSGRAFVGEEEIGLLDDAGLTGMRRDRIDSTSSAELLDFLRRSVAEHGQSIVMVTHDPRGAAYSDRVVFLADGKVVGEQDSPTAESVVAQMMTLGK